MSQQRDSAWKLRAVTLAVQRGLAGQAQFDRQLTTVVSQFRVVSANEHSDHLVVYDAFSQFVGCDCLAGDHETACSHAGAVLLLIAGLAPSRTRPPEGVQNAGNG